MNITPEAAAAIQTLLSTRDRGGLRIFLTTPPDNGSRLDMSLALINEPDPDDEVVAEHGSRVFVEQRLSSALANKTLDVAEPGSPKRVGFRLFS